MTTVTLELPEEVASQAREAGLLAPERLTAVLEFELRHEAMKRFLGTSCPEADVPGEFASDQEVAMFVAGEIKAARAERREAARP
jgi:hypothetical protein